MSQNRPSKTSVRNAGSTIRRYARGEATPEELESAVEIMYTFRAMFSEPLVVVNNTLRTLCEDAGLESEVTQRLKKSSTILDKLSREQGLNLSRMQDVGGCRAVLNSVPEVRLLESLIYDSWGSAVDHTKDYITEPRESGYRAVHVVVVQEDCPIEIQIRTTVMHSWAETVEAFSQVTNMNFKQDGAHDVQELLKMMSQIDQMAEEHEGVPDWIVDRVATLKAEVRSFLASAPLMEHERKS